MPKDQKVYKDRTQYLNTQQTETLRQILAKERRILAPKTNADIERLDPYFNKNNNYMALMKKNPEQRNEEAIKFEHPIDQLGQIQYEYCQKCHRDQKFCPHQNVKRLDKRKNEYNYPLTSTQTYGWLQPIDDAGQNFGLKSTLQQFHLSFREVKQPKPN